METNTSPFLLIFRDTAHAANVLSPAQRQELYQEWLDWYNGLAARGQVQLGHPLEESGRVVSAGGRVVDGPFAESKEAVGGFFLLTVGDLDEATEVAHGCPSLKWGLVTVEVRPVAEMCPQFRTEDSGQPAHEVAMS
jgi:hypothetical protein